VVEKVAQVVPAQVILNMVERAAAGLGGLAVLEPTVAGRFLLERAVAGAADAKQSLSGKMAKRAGAATPMPLVVLVVAFMERMATTKPMSMPLQPVGVVAATYRVLAKLGGTVECLPVVRVAAAAAPPQVVRVVRVGTVSAGCGRYRV
jgi:hypothetical protein